MLNTIVKVEGLVKQFGNFAAVDDISFQVTEGEIFGFLGANGAGKTTVMRILCGLLSPTSGLATVCGYDVYKQREQIKANIGYLSQRFSLFDDLSVWDNIQFYAGIYGMKQAEIEEAGNSLLHKLDIHKHKKKLAGDLPLGWKQKLAFSIAIIHKPRLVFLDEPTGGVDPITRRSFWDMISEATEHGVTAFVTTHYLDEAEYCDRICMMVRGKIAALGAPAELKHSYSAASIYDVFLSLARGEQ